jgi:hypothetical protein
MDADDLIRQLSDEEKKPRTPPLVADLATAAAIALLAVLSVANHAQVPFLAGVDLGVHEFGHMIAFWAPRTLTLLAGSGLQILAPLGLAAYFLLGRHERLSAALCLAWAGSSARNVAVYVADAPYQRLPLWGGDGVIHDWAFLLAHGLGLAAPLAGVVEVLAWLLLAAALVLALAGVLGRLNRATPGER